MYLLLEVFHGELHGGRALGGGGEVVVVLLGGCEFGRVCVLKDGIKMGAKRMCWWMSQVAVL